MSELVLPAPVATAPRRGWRSWILLGALGFLSGASAAPVPGAAEAVGEASACFWVAAEVDCPEVARARLAQRLEEQLVIVDDGRAVPFELEPGWLALRLRFHELASRVGRGYVRPLPVDCASALRPRAEDRCAPVYPFVAADLQVGWRAGAREGWGVPLVGLPVAVQFALSGATELAATAGVAPSLPGLGFDLAAPDSWGLEVGEELELRVAGRVEPAQVQLLYRCPRGRRCALFAEPAAVVRARRWQQGRVASGGSSRRPGELPAGEAVPRARVHESELVLAGSEIGG